MKRILLVDDHQLLRMGLRSLLDGRYEVCGEAANGLEAVEKAQALRPDLILMDFAMPIMDGLDASRRIRSTDSNVKIVLFTMHDSADVHVNAKTAGVDAVLTKGCGPREMIAVLERLLNGAPDRSFAIY